MPLRLFYHRDPRGNFGDDLNAWLWPKLLPDLLTDGSASTLLVGIGTILNAKVPPGPGKVVLGSGVGYGKLPAVDDKWRFYGVRGPKSAAALGLAADLAITDGAILLRDLVAPTPPSDRSGTVFIPHHESVYRLEARGVNLPSLVASAGFDYLDPRWPVQDVIECIGRAERVITEAMHGAIFADTLRVLWRPVRLFGHVLSSKWIDWTASLSLDYQPRDLDASNLEVALKQQAGDGGATWHLSADPPFVTALDEMRRALDRLREDATAGRLPDGEAFASDDEDTLGLPAGTASWWHALAAAARQIGAAAGNSPVALADDGTWSADDVAFETPIRFLPDLTSDFDGPPADEAGAVAGLDTATSAGLNFVAILWTTRWWLDAYPNFAAALRRDYATVYDTPVCTVWQRR